MKKFIPLLFFFILWAAAADGKSLEASKRAGDYQVEIVIDRNPPVAIGNNNIEIEIKDKTGRVVTDAQVLINYYMPPMPRMAPMNYKTEAKMKKGKYYAAMKFIMAGPWYIAIIIHRDGKTSTTKINVDAQ
jgi:acetoacetate decarboxylase